MASIKDYARMCRAHGGMCTLKECPISYRANGNCALCGVFLRTQTAEAEAIIDQWCAEHPQKTYMQDFFEKFPKAPKEKRGSPEACRTVIYGGACPQNHDCPACWNEVMLEEANENSNA